MKKLEGRQVVTLAGIAAAVMLAALGAVDGDALLAFLGGALAPSPFERKGRP